ncbi:MAG TPA: DUF5008 domain-containing protein [Sphingobacterium sp.]|nr:DUF5008 domain-containing protein [Sphingobacterium sp.]
MGKFLNTWTVMSIAIGTLLTQSCTKTTEPGKDPYAGGKEPLGVLFENLNRPLAEVRPGEEFEIAVRGVKRHEADVEVYINEERSEIISLTDSTMELRVPEQVASGIIKLKIKDQVYFGPRVPIEGKTTFDNDYGVTNGFNQAVRYILPTSNGNEFWITGTFTDFENEASATIFRNNIHKITSLGTSAKQDDNAYDPRKGGVGGINSMTRLPNGKYIIGGHINSFNDYTVNGIARLNSSGSLDTAVVEVINNTPNIPDNGKDTLSAFNAYLFADLVTLSSSVSHVFATEDNGVIAVGNFGEHGYIDYNYSSRDAQQFVYTTVRNIVRLKADGRVDSLFGYNNTGANGFINGAIETNSGKIVLVGDFTTFNGQARNRIIAFNKDGSVDDSFNIGGGANEAIFSITYNKSLDKIVLAGRFRNFNGQPKAGVVVLNGDGSVDPTFTLGNIEDGIPNYAYMMNNGRLLISGQLTRYNGVHRSRLLILEPDGTALQEYNNFGEFLGQIYTVVETTSSMGYPALLIGGSIGIADGKPVGHLFKLEVRN